MSEWIALRGAADQEPAIGLAFVPQTAFDLERERDAFDMVAQLAPHALGFFRMDQRQPILHGAETVFLLISQQFAPARREIDAVISQAPIPDTIARTAHH